MMKIPVSTPHTQYFAAPVSTDKDTHAFVKEIVLLFSKLILASADLRLEVVLDMARARFGFQVFSYESGGLDAANRLLLHNFAIIVVNEGCVTGILMPRRREPTDIVQPFSMTHMIERCTEYSASAETAPALLNPLWN